MERAHHLLSPRCRAWPLPSTSPHPCQYHWLSPVLSNYLFRDKRQKARQMGPTLHKSSPNSFLVLWSPSMAVPCPLQAPHQVRDSGGLLPRQWGKNPGSKCCTTKPCCSSRRIQPLLCIPVAARAWQHQTMVLFTQQETGRVEA